jgi:hypothetical protein
VVAIILELKKVTWKFYFKTKQGLFEGLDMPFGLCNVPMTFMRVINDVFRLYMEYFFIA